MSFCVDLVEDWKKRWAKPRICSCRRENMRILGYMTNFTFNEKALVPVNGDQLDEVSKGAFYNPH